jgi:hypothetical protein
MNNTGTTDNVVLQGQGSNDHSSWTNIGSTFTMTIGGSSPQIYTNWSANVTGYRYYRWAFVSGTSATAAYYEEAEFKQCTC